MPNLSYRMAHVARRRYMHLDQEAHRRAAARARGNPPRDEQAVASAATLTNLLAVQRASFRPAQRPVVPRKAVPEVAALAEQLWSERKNEVPSWQRSKRAALRAQINEVARVHVQALVAEAEQQRSNLQSDADEWWRRLQAGDPQVTGSALERAFDPSPVPVMVAGLGADLARLRVMLPNPTAVLPPKLAHTTPTGRRSVRAWTKAEFDAAYRGALAAYLLATIRRAWAAAPSLRELTVRGQRTSDGTNGFLFEVTVSRDETGWDRDDKGLELLGREPRPLRTKASAQHPVLWPFS